MKLKYLLAGLVGFLSCASLAGGQSYTVAQTATFKPQNKKILLLKDSANAQREIILFQTNLRVNTDGSPKSYHPQDLRGKDKALNNICNAIVVRKGASDKNLCITNFGEAVGVFEKFRDTGYQTVPPGFQITWANVLAKTKENGKDVPCVFQSGEFKGYFGSLISLKNDLTGDKKGECEVNNQVNPLTVPTLVLVGGKNAVTNFGARLGDLVVAYNPKTQLFSPAIIGDTGPADNLGEGSVSLNMKLLGETVPPTKKADTFKLSIEKAQVLVAIIPRSRLFRVTKPYTAENINQRIRDWQKESGFDTPEKFIELMKSFQPKLQ
jgi:hypothetical protein